MQASKAAPVQRAQVAPATPDLAAEVRQSALLLGLVLGVVAAVTAMASALQWLA